MSAPLDLAPPEAEAVLDFWFAGDVGAQNARWWGKNVAVDAEIARRFGPLLVPAAGGAFDGWRGSERGTLALVLVLDQLTRNAHRGSPLAFAFDAKAREVAVEAIDHGVDRALAVGERTWLYMPLMHSEQLAHQERCVALFAAHVLSLAGEVRKAAEGSLGFARAHRDIIHRFGRFPHRNAVLGRQSTPEELAFLQEPGSGF